MPATSPPTGDDDELMHVALAAAATARIRAHPNPWVGAAIRTADGEVVSGATQVPGSSHAEVDAIRRAGPAARGGTMAVTLEPCSFHGRTGPCAEAVIDAGLARVVVALEDPDARVSGRGVAMLRDAGIEVTVGVGGVAAAEQLAPYLHQRRTGRPYVVLKLAATLDGGIAAPDTTSQWITGDAARADAHRLRAESDVIIVGAGTVRADDPSLTVRHVDGPDPLRVVLGEIPAGARVLPARSERRPLAEVLDDLGAEGHLQVLLEGGARVAAEAHRAGLVDHYVLYLAPALFGGDDSRRLFAGPGAATIDDLWRGEIVATTMLGPDLRVDLRPVTPVS